MDIDLEQAFVVGYFFGQLSSLTYYSDQAFVEASPKQLPLYLNIVYTLDSYTWLSLFIAMIIVCFVLRTATWKSSKKVFQMHLLQTKAKSLYYYTVDKTNTKSF